MRDPHTEKPGSILAKPGDVYVTRTKSLSSVLIRAATLSKWSHVGIVVDSELVLEAVKTNSSSADFATKVRVVTIKTFAANTSAMRHYIRPKKLSTSQIEKLNAFVNSNERKGYTTMHAAFTALIPIMRLWFAALAIVSMLDLWVKSEPSTDSTPSLILAALTISGIIYLSYSLLVWSIRSDWGVKTTESIFRRNRFGRWLVEIKHEMFCSKLVLLADKKIGGSLDSFAPNEYEVQPKHIAEACEEAGWRSVNI